MNLPEYFVSDIAATLGFGFIAIFLMVAGYKIFDKVTPGLSFDAEIKKGNMAMAVLLGAFILGLCFVIGKVVAAVMG